MFGFFSSKLGCIGSIGVSIVGTLILNGGHARMQRRTKAAKS
jgi:hypothetical protein